MKNVLEEVVRNQHIVLQCSVLSDLEELGDKEFLVLMDHYNILNRSFNLQNSIAPSSSRGR